VKGPGGRPAGRACRKTGTARSIREIDLAHAGAAALAKMRKAQYGLVISDRNMQPMSGLELLKHVRADLALAGMRVVMMSAQSSIENAMAAEDAGVDSFIVKPFTAAILKEKIDKVFTSADVA
jgi:two-component system chemotaxis response regulator CheY